MSKHWFKIAEAKAGRGAEVAILDDIGFFGVTAADFNQSLASLGSPEKLTIRISSNGGDIVTGVAIFNMLARHKAHKVVVVESLAASMGSVIAMAGDEIIMPSNAMMMIHDPFGQVSGKPEEIVSFGEALGYMRDNIVAAYVDKSLQPEDDIRAMMAKETWLTAKMAVELGFATKVEKPANVLAHVDTSRFKRTPKTFSKLIAKIGDNMTTNTNGKGKGRNAAAHDDDESFERDDPRTETEIRADMLAQQKEVRSLCKLAGKPDLAEGFIAEDKSVPEVIAALETAATADAEAAAKAKGKGRAAKATTDGAPEISAHHSISESAATDKLDPAKIYGKWNSVAKKH